MLHRRFRRVVITASILVACFGWADRRQCVHAEIQVISLADAVESGTFTSGNATATLSTSSRTSPNAPAPFVLGYRVDTGGAAFLWTKNYPTPPTAENSDVVTISGKVSEDDPIHKGLVTVVLEVKGSAGAQQIPILVETLSLPQQSQVVPLAWNQIGTFQEAVISVKPTGESDAVEGSIQVQATFRRLSFHESELFRQWTRIGLVVLGASLAWLVLNTLRKSLSSRNEPVNRTREEDVSGIRRDLVQGIGLIAIVGLSLAVQGVNALDRQAEPWIPLAFAFAGVALSEWWMYGLTGRHLEPSAVFLDAMATGLLAAASSASPLLQVPGSWSELFMLSSFGAATTLLLYHAANAFQVSSSGRHLSSEGGLAILSAPFAIGVLLLLGAGDLLRPLGQALTWRAFDTEPSGRVAHRIAQLLVLFGFNLGMGNLLSFEANRSRLRGVGTAALFLMVALGVIVAPDVALLGSGEWLAKSPPWIQLVVVVATTSLSQGGLWAQVYLLTGMVLGAIRGRAPSLASCREQSFTGLKKGMIYGAVFIACLQVPYMLWQVGWIRATALRFPLSFSVLVGALVFPLIKTIIETFDGSQSFFRRLALSYRNPVLYLRGAVVGLGLGYGLSHSFSAQNVRTRMLLGFGTGAMAYAGVNALRDLVYARSGRGRRQPARVYIVQGGLGGAIGAAIGFYLDAPQLAVIAGKIYQYVNVNRPEVDYNINALLSRWGAMSLGMVRGGASLIFAESLAGVISWSIPAWLFTLNRTFMAAYFERQTAPIRKLFSREGLVEMGENMIGVLRWGLWMSPIINSFLRPTGVPSWYNQDGAVRTLLAIGHQATSSPEAFRTWSLNVFIALMAYDWVRILIWLDHMGLRVATLVNLSFLGTDRLDRRLARWLAPAATSRCIPEAVKRFTTWAPLLLPYYIPRGSDWDVAWSRSQALRVASSGGFLASLSALAPMSQLGLLTGSVVASTLVFSGLRRFRQKELRRRPAPLILENRNYQVSLHANGEFRSHSKARGYDVTRRSYDGLDPAGKSLFLVDQNADAPGARVWPLVGNVPGHPASRAILGPTGNELIIDSTQNGLRVHVEVRLVEGDEPGEIWTVTIENQTTSTRDLRLVPYLEWVLNQPGADRGHTQYNRLFAEVEYVHELQAVLAHDQHSHSLGILAADHRPTGFLSTRVDFLGRARSLGDPLGLENFAFLPANDTEAHPTFDPIGALLLDLHLTPHGSTQVQILVGLVAEKTEAIRLVARSFDRVDGARVDARKKRKAEHAIGHGETPAGADEPYWSHSEDGQFLKIHTPFTTRPYDHTLSNALGHVVSVTNRGLHTSSNVNAQQNRLTPDWADTVTREVPSEAFYLHDPATREWFSPTYHPLNDADASYEVDFGVDGTARFQMTKGDLELDLTVFVPPDEPAGVYLLKIRNRGNRTRRLRVAPYFQMVLSGQPEDAGPLRIRSSPELNALFFENPRNLYRSGPAFAAVSIAPRQTEHDRGRFFGIEPDLRYPYFVEREEPAPKSASDTRPIAAFLLDLEVAPGAERTVVTLLGQSDEPEVATRVIQSLGHPEGAEDALERTRQWWTGLMRTVDVQTSRPDFDRYLNWLKYQALAERIWARRGFYQASGAFGFRDQLQDTVNLIWVEPQFARNQLQLHASQQFLEGDVVHWFHQLQDGRTGFSGRTHASDNLLWLAWGVLEYVHATGDESLLDEQTPYLESDIPFLPLPEGKHGMGFDPLRSPVEDSIYRHCLKAIDLVLNKRMGVHGLPLIGTGDWNDGLDEIGAQGRGESVWLGFFLQIILKGFLPIIRRIDGVDDEQVYLQHLKALEAALEETWREDRYLRAFHDDGTEIGVKGSGIWEIDALTAAWAVMSGINLARGRIVFETALSVLERDKTILLGWPPLREDSKPYLGRSSRYPEGVRENGMYCHGVQWLVGAARILAKQAKLAGNSAEAQRYLEIAYRLWFKITAIPHTEGGEVETYGGQPNKQAADMVTTFEPGRMIWNGYTGAAGWLFRQAIEGVLGFSLVDGQIRDEHADQPSNQITLKSLHRDLSHSPLREQPD